MTTTEVRKELHKLVDELPENELHTAQRFLQYLVVIEDNSGVKTLENVTPSDVHSTDDKLHPAFWCDDRIIQDAVKLGKECWNLDRKGGYSGLRKITNAWSQSKILSDSLKIRVHVEPPSAQIAFYVYTNLSQEYEATKDLETCIETARNDFRFHIMATSNNDPDDLENVRCVLYNDKNIKYEAVDMITGDIEYGTSEYSRYWYVKFNLFDNSGMPTISKESKGFKLVVILSSGRAELTWDLTALPK